ncbi:MAG: galactose-1-phosphate uridylyltransferase [Oscillospiraceae bacterium]|jgi:UDPglucose--hexose-1-phosphate uridylyltransferase|nr:galactose-1-phosphate uridylyltransferase [Oscillospiraceae bacterium]
MAELRYDPFTQDYIMIASNRQNRPQMPKNWCPFCPGSGKVPDNYDVYKYDNDFPSLRQDPPEPDDVSTQPVFKTLPCYGKCEVILYSPNHTITLPELPVSHVQKLVDLWIERFNAIGADKKIKHVYIFENRGEMIGVTMPHPHGQIYGYSVIPKKIALELESAREYFEENGRSLFADVLQAELADGRRIIFENSEFVVYLPFYSPYPYAVNIMPRKNLQYISQFDENQKALFARTVRDTAGMLDSLFDIKFPYMMCMHNAPVNSGDMGFFRFHVEFFSPVRSADNRQFDASSETGAWAHCNQTCPEDKAIELHAAYKKFTGQNWESNKK